MVRNLSSPPSLINHFIAELRDENIQKDRMRFRKNLERLGEVFAYEISKTMDYEAHTIQTPLGLANTELMREKIVLSTILRAGLPFHNGFLSFFDQAENAFIAAYRAHHKDGTFDVQLEYITTPNIDDKILILCDPLLATGSSAEQGLNAILEYGRPKEIHLASVIASSSSIQYLKRQFPKIQIWIGAEDEELTAKSYIVPGLGDAGDLAFGPKQDD